MLDVAWPELLVIGAVALVAIGPKDLPRVMRSLGRMAAKARRIMHDLQGSFEQLSYEAEAAERIKRDAAKRAENTPPDETDSLPKESVDARKHKTGSPPSRG